MTESTNTDGKTVERYRHAGGWKQCLRSGMTRAEAEKRRDRLLRLLRRLRCAGPHEVAEPYRIYAAFVK